jgi:hypothetical protein
MSKIYHDFKFVPKCNGLLYNEANESFTIDDNSNTKYEFIDFYPTLINVSGKTFKNVTRAWMSKNKGSFNIVFMVLVEIAAIPYQQLKKMKIWDILPQDLKENIKNGKVKGVVLGNEMPSPKNQESKKEKVKVIEKPIEINFDNYGELQEDNEEDGDVLVLEKIKKTKKAEKTQAKPELKTKIKPEIKMDNTPNTENKTDINVPSLESPNISTRKRGRPTSSSIKSLTCTKCKNTQYYGPSYIAKFALGKNITVEELANTWTCSTCVPRRKGRKPFAQTDPILATIPKQITCIACKKQIAIIPKQLKEKAEKMKVAIDWLVQNYKCRNCGGRVGNVKA